MKKIVLYFVLAVFIASCKKEVAKKTPVVTKKEVFNNFDWLLGNWERNGDKEGENTFEIWNKKNNTHYSGIGFTLKEKDTIKKEKMNLIKLKEDWFLQVQTKDEATVFKFKMTSHTPTEFICENDTLDFPKSIKYWTSNNKLNALVKNDDLKINFNFKHAEF